MFNVLMFFRLKFDDMDFSRIDNEDLHDMCRQGDELAWAYVYNYVCVITRSWRWELQDTPEDMAQDIVCKLIDRALARLKEPKKFRSFIRTVTKHHIIDHLRRKGIVIWMGSMPARDSSAGVLDPPSPNPGPERTTYGRQVFDAFKNGLDNLSGECQAVLTGYAEYKCGLFRDMQELADHFGKSVGTISSRIKRCLDKLRKIEAIEEWLDADTAP